MSELSKQALKVDNNQSFPNNNNGAITPAILRSFNEDMIDSTVNQTIYTADSASWVNEIDVLNQFSSSQHNINQTLATTGSNTFNGNQTINGTLNVDTINAVSGTAVTIGNDLDVTGGLVADLPNGYVWLGNSGGRAVAVPSSSIAAGGSTDLGPLNAYTASNDVKWSNLGSQSGSWVTESETGSFARTDVSNTFTATQNIQGDLNITGTITANEIHTIIESSSVIFSSGSNILGDSTSDTQTLNGTVRVSGSEEITGSLGVSGATTINGNTVIGNSSTLNVAGEIVSNDRMYVFNQYGGIDIQQNRQGSGSQYPGMSMKVAPNTYPTDIFGGFTVLTEQGAIAGTTYLGLVANSYSTQYGGTTVPMIIANGNNPAGNDTAIIWKTDGTAEHWKKSDFKYGIDVTGSLNVTGSIRLIPASVSTNASYPITFVSGTTLSKDSVDTLLYNPSTNTLNVSASTGNASISPNAISFTSGSGVGTYSATLSKTAIVSTVETGYTIGLSGNPSKIGAPSLASNTKPAIYASSGSGVPYVAIELQASQSFTDGRVTIKRPLALEQGITGSTIINGDSQITGSLGVSGQISGKGGLFVTGGNVVVQDNNISTNKNLIVGTDAVVNGNAQITGSITTNGGLDVYNLYGGINIKANAQGSGSQYPGFNLTVAPNVYPTDVFGGFSILTEQGAIAGATFLGMAASTYSPQYFGTNVPMIIAQGNNPGGNDTAIIWTSNGNAEHWKKSLFKYGVEVTGSVNGNIVSQSIAASTASFDFGSSNFFELKLADSAVTYVTATNVKPGQTVNVKVTQASLSTGSIVFDSKFKFPAVSPYTASNGVDDIDIITFVTFSDTGSIYSAAVKNMI